MPFPSSPSLTLLFFVLMEFLCSYSMARKFYVGGDDGWTLHPSKNYNEWAEKYRFQINDTLVFKYHKGRDSVLVVNHNDYTKCNKENPIRVLHYRSSIYRFEKSGPFFFISGHDQNCEKGEKLNIVVISPNHHNTIAPSVPPLEPHSSASPAPSHRAQTAHHSPTPSPVAETPTHASPVKSPSPKHTPRVHPPSHSPSPTSTRTPLAKTPSHSPSPSSAAKNPTYAPLVKSPTKTPTHAPLVKSPSSSPTAKAPAHAPTVKPTSHSPATKAPTQAPHAHTPSHSSPKAKSPKNNNGAAHLRPPVFLPHHA